MKKAMLILGAAAFLFATPSCKKGENDPAMSLKSRKARLAGTWTLTNIDMTTTDVSSWGGNTFTTVDVTAYDNSVDDSVRYTNSVSIDGGTPVVSNSADHQTAEHVFGKDGAYDVTQITNGNTWQASGYWSFVGKSKTTDLKKKEAVMLTYTSTISGGNTNNYTGNSMFPDGYMLLDRLSGKEMIVKVDQMNTYSNGDTWTQTGTMTFAKQ